ncbi:hypothetical protein DPMN_119347 [Dreissena polymorpha]|uniref:Uncharacterized protein n=1 Tax=Dreissena polymorpha TaxID=45954 RepID=A0A9D4JRW8_DREPO|nr:hypothetical protein DPMN_119347 [Dreissena polymorpha]
MNLSKQQIGGYCKNGTAKMVTVKAGHFPGHSKKEAVADSARKKKEDKNAMFYALNEMYISVSRVSRTGMLSWLTLHRVLH